MAQLLLLRAPSGFGAASADGCGGASDGVRRGIRRVRRRFAAACHALAGAATTSGLGAGFAARSDSGLAESTASTTVSSALFSPFYGGWPSLEGSEGVNGAGVEVASSKVDQCISFAENCTRLTDEGLRASFALDDQTLDGLMVSSGEPWVKYKKCLERCTVELAYDPVADSVSRRWRLEGPAACGPPPVRIRAYRVHPYTGRPVDADERDEIRAVALIQRALIERARRAGREINLKIGA